MRSNNTQLKCTWTNGLIWGGILTVVSLAVRFALWYFVFYWDAKNYTNEFCDMTRPLMLVPVVIPLLMHLISYRGYMNLAANHPSNLHGVAHGSYGKPWILPMILQLILEIVWIIVCAVIVSISNEMDLMLDADRMIMIVFVALNVVSLVVDLVLFLLGNRLFKPDLVQSNA